LAHHPPISAANWNSHLTDYFFVNFVNSVLEGNINVLIFVFN